MLNRYITILFFFGYSSAVTGQICSQTIKGNITDLGSGGAIQYGNVFIEELKTGAVTDSLGDFFIQNICKGNYHLVFSHIGCESKELYLELTSDTVLKIILDHNHHELHEFSVSTHKETVEIQESTALEIETIRENANASLSCLIEQISGVSSIKNGSGIDKPVVHGMYGNRLAIINNGVAQSGQQWGSDHSPEIDPLVANEITVVKGVGALKFQSNSLGSVILVEPNNIQREPHLHGSANYFFESNGLGNGFNFSVQQYKNIGWRATATVKKSGDKHTPNYYLRNTGNEEANVALQFEKSITKHWNASAYFSSFNARLGVLRGSHIGNLTDLEEAFERTEPFFTQEEFSYDISAPFQEVNHHFGKLQTSYYFTDNQSIELTYAVQINQRKEFDVRRGGRTGKPALSLEQVSNFTELNYKNQFGKEWELKTGLQSNFTDNVNLPETGILPLIPNYVSAEYGGFITLEKSWKKAAVELGGRYDYENRKVADISTDLPRRVVKYDNVYENLSALLGANYAVTKSWKITGNIGLAQRNPEVNELYSNGLHQGVSGIELGDINLQPETSIKATLSVKGKVKQKLFIEALGYHQQIQDYIFLNPTNLVRLTIRGAFPLFEYQQTNATISGLDLSAIYQINNRLATKVQYSYLFGRDTEAGIPLVFMPANNLFGNLTYDFKQWKKLENIELEINNRYVFEQTNLLPEQDFIAPPESYYLLGAKLSAKRQVNKLRFHFYVKGENLLNQAYRDYLNRQRYFADDLGINFIVGINAKF